MILPAHIVSLLESFGVALDTFLVGIRSGDPFVVAAWVAEKGFRVIPVRQGSKIPRIKEWPILATTNLKRLLLWQRVLRPDWAVLSGTENGVWILDIDGSDGFSDVKQLEIGLGPLPQTVAVESGRVGGGRHLWFKPTPGVEDLRTVSHVFGTALDIRGWHGNAILPGSLHVSGNRYRWVEGCAPDECELAELPPLWAEALPKRRIGPIRRDSGRRQDCQLSKPPTATCGDSLLIGDGEGRGGFNKPIFRIAVRYFLSAGPDADCMPILSFLRKAILEAPRRGARPASDIERYASDGYLQREIDSARRSAKLLKEQS